MGYFYTCHICGSAYCYIHMSRHARAHSSQGSGRQVSEIYAS